MTKRNTLILIGLALLCVIYVVVFFFLTGSNKASEGYLLVSDLGGFYCKARKCNYTKISDIHLEGKKIKTYQQNELKGTYELSYLDRWNFFQNNEWVSFYGDFLGIDESLNANLMPLEYKELTEEDTSFIKEIIQKNGCSYTNLDKNYAILIDLDENGTMDQLISVSNQTEEEQNSKYFSIFFAILNGKVVKIYEEYTEDKYQLPYNHVFGVVKLDEEKSPRVIVNQNYFDQTGSPSILLYQLNGKKFKVVAEETNE